MSHERLIGRPPKMLKSTRQDLLRTELNNRIFVFGGIKNPGDDFHHTSNQKLKQERLLKLRCSGEELGTGME